MKRTTLATTIATVTIALAALTAPARAATAAGSLIAEDTTPAPVQTPDASVIGVDANIVAGLSVTGHRGRPVTLTSRGEKPRTATAPASKPVVFRGLTAGRAYVVAIDGSRIGAATPVSKPGAAYGLKVATTATPGEVELAWSQQASRTAGKVNYRVTAAPVVGLAARSGSTLAPMTITAATTEAVISGLDTGVLYTFTVTPANSAADGAASSATMTRTLAALAGTATAAVDPAPAPAPAPVTEPAPAPSSGGGGGGGGGGGASTPVAPATKTVFVCPDGYGEADDLCTQTLAYTFHDVTTTSPYTYHQVFTKTGQHFVGVNRQWDGACVGGTDYGSTCGYWEDEGYYSSVKDAPPTGFSDTGSKYAKTESVKDDLPSGYSDNGSAWVKTAAKVTRVVPA